MAHHAAQADAQRQRARACGARGETDCAIPISNPRYIKIGESLTREMLMTESPCQPTNVSVSAPVVPVVAISGWSASASICWPRASQHIRNSSPGLLHGGDWLTLKALQLLPEPCQRSSDGLESLLSIPWCPCARPPLGAGCPPHLHLIRAIHACDCESRGRVYYTWPALAP